MFLYAILPPGNLAGEITRVRKLLFSKYGIVSALAFPSVIPLGFSLLSPDKLPGGRKPAPRQMAGKSVSPLLSVENTLFFPVELNEWESDFINKQHLISAPGLPSGLSFLPFPAFFMGICESSTDFISMKEFSIEIRWKRAAYICYKMETDEPECWWENVLFSEVI